MILSPPPFLSCTYSYSLLSIKPSAYFYLLAYYQLYCNIALQSSAYRVEAAGTDEDDRGEGGGGQQVGPLHDLECQLDHRQNNQKYCGF